jgi:nucleoside-diphosphate-sugar epimerase
MRALVTGGGGYLGLEIVRQLRARGDDVVVVGRGRYPAAEALGATCRPVDLTADGPALTEAMHGCDVVFHVAALPPDWRPRSDFLATNVDGTRRVLDAARASGVRRLVYTSTPSVAFHGVPQDGVRAQDVPYPSSFGSPYAETKAIAERMALAAHSPELAVTALRPRLIYGPDEPHMLPRLLARHRAGRLRIVGDGANRVSLTFRENAAAGHLQAADRLTPDAPHGGRAYFLADDGPVALWDWLNELFAGVGLPPLTRRVPLPAALAVGAICEAAWTLLPLPGEPPMTRFIARNLATTAWYRLDEAREDFGYAPPVSGADGLARTLAALRR